MTAVHLLVFLLCLLAFGALALATDRVQGDLFRRELAPGATRRLRLLGWATLLVALGVLLRAQGWGLGLVSYSGHTSLAAGLVLLALILLDRRRARR